MIEHRPLKVTAVMAEPVVYHGDGLHLDGILSWGAYLQHVREHGDDLPPINAPWAIDFDLPLARWSRPLPEGALCDRRLLDDNGKVWGWCASAAIADWVAHSKVEFRKRPDTAAMTRYTTSPSHNAGAGPHKAYDIAYPTRLAFEIEWYARGDKDGLLGLIKHVTHIGKKTRTGMGQVLRWRVEDMGADWSVERDGRPMRRMPAEDGAPGSIRPPYHHPSRVVPCVEPC